MVTETIGRDDGNVGHFSEVHPSGCAVKCVSSSEASPHLRSQGMPAENYSNEALADRIDVAREKLTMVDRFGKTVPLSQGELERRVGMSDPKTGKGKGYISRIRNGDRGTSLKREWLVALARELNVTLVWLMSGVGPMHPEPDAAPIGGLALARFIAVRLNYHPEAVDTISKRFETEPNADANAILMFMERESTHLRDRDAARAGHADNAKKVRVKLDAIASKESRADRKQLGALGALLTSGEKMKEPEKKPASKRKLKAVDD